MSDTNINPEELKIGLDTLRGLLKESVDMAFDLKQLVINSPAISQDRAPEIVANITLAYRHLEDAAMRFGKAIQASDSGVSPLGGPNTPGMK